MADVAGEAADSVDSGQGGKLNQQVVSAEGKSQDHGTESAEIPNGLPKIAQTVPDHVEAMPTRRPARMSFTKPKNEV